MSRWIRLNIDWHLSEWLIPLSAEAQLCWVRLLCYVKGHGHGGKVKAIDPLVASRMWFVGEESVRQMLIAAKKSGALVENSAGWSLAKWREYQGDETGAERQRRFKDKQVTEGNALVTEVTPTETETETETLKKPTKKEVESYMGERGWQEPELNAQRFLDHYEKVGWLTGKSRLPVKSWKACVRTWEKTKKTDDGWSLPQ